MEKTTFIYALTNPLTRDIRYIGKADDPNHRFDQHIVESKRGKTYKDKWLRSLLAQGLRPVLLIVDEVLESEWQAAEAAYIAFYKDEGCRLVNSAPGGNGFGGGKEHPWFGKTFSTEHLANLSKASKGRMLGRRHSESTLAKISASQKGKVIPDEQRRKIADALKGKRPSDETRSKMRLAKAGQYDGENNNFFGKKHTLDTKAKMSAARLGVPMMGTSWWNGKTHSESTKEKMRASQSERQNRELMMRWISAMWT